jgi:glycosyltransferase involved in cell wall biosynthesis
LVCAIWGATRVNAHENRLVRIRLAELFPDISVTLIAPKSFSTNRYGPEISYDARPEDRGNCHVRPLPLVGTRFQRYVGLGTLLREQQPDILCIAQERFSWSTHVALMQSKWYSRKTKTISYTLVNIDYRLKWLHHYLKEKLFFKLSDAIFALDEESLSILLLHGYGGIAQNLYLLGAVDDVQSQTKLDKPEVPLVIGYTGKISPEKGVFDLIRAVAGLHGD